MIRPIRCPVLALLTVGFAIVVLSRIGSALWIQRSVPESASRQIIPALWFNFIVELAVLTCIFFAVRWLVERDRRDRKDQARTDRLADMAVLAAGFAHEARNLLHAMNARIDLLRKTVAGNEKGVERLNKLDELANSMQHLFTDFLTFARPGEDQLEETDIVSLVRQVLDFEQLELERLGITTSFEADENIPQSLVDRGKLKRALLNLIVNARQAMPEGGELKLQVASQRGKVRIDIQDTGCGIPKSEQRRVFETYFTTKTEGTGLGLAIVERTIEDLGGRITFKSVPDRGTTFSIVLPSIDQHRANVARLAGTTHHNNSSG